MHEPADVLARHQASRPARRPAWRPVAAHAAPRLCHPSHQSRRRSARGAAAAGTRRHHHHADLHARGPRAPETIAFAAPSARLSMELFDYSPTLLIVAPLVVLFAYFMFGIGGFGSAVIVVPLLAHWLPLAF